MVLFFTSSNSVIPDSNTECMQINLNSNFKTEVRKFKLCLTSLISLIVISIEMITDFDVYGKPTWHVYDIKKTGPNTEPCGTQQLSGTELDMEKPSPFSQLTELKNTDREWSTVWSR